MEYAIQDTFQITHPPQRHFSNTFPKRLEFTPTLHYMQISKAYFISWNVIYADPFGEMHWLEKAFEGVDGLAED